MAKEIPGGILETSLEEIPVKIVGKSQKGITRILGAISGKLPGGSLPRILGRISGGLIGTWVIP